MLCCSMFRFLLTFFDMNYLSQRSKPLKIYSSFPASTALLPQKGFLVRVRLTFKAFENDGIITTGRITFPANSKDTIVKNRKWGTIWTLVVGRKLGFILWHWNKKYEAVSCYQEGKSFWTTRSAGKITSIVILNQWTIRNNNIEMLFSVTTKLSRLILRNANETANHL